MKMHKNIRIITWLCAVMMIFSMMGCGSSGSSPVPGSTAAESGEQLPQKPSDEAAESTAQPASDKQTETVPAQTGTSHAAPETTDPESIPETTVAPETAEPAPETEPGDDEDLKELMALACDKYRHLLAVHQEAIETENFFMIHDPNGDGERPLSVVIADIFGDAIPEIIFVETGMDQNLESQLLEIYTFDGTTVSLLYEDTVNVAAGGGKVFLLFGDGEDREPWLYVQGGEYKTSWAKVVRLRFEDGGDGSYLWTGTRFDCVENDEDAEPEERSREDEWSFTDENGTEILTKEEYHGRLDPILNEAQPLLHNYQGDFMPDYLAGKTMQAMTYDEAMAWLDEQTGAGDEPGDEETEEPDAAASELFEMIQGVYFQHGGDWTTDLTVYADGSFTGSYKAHYLMDEKTHYDIGDFHGRFSDAEQQDELTWTIRVESLVVEGETGEEQEDDEATYTRIDDPASPVEGSVLTVYLPGSDTAQIPEEFFTWIRADRDQMPELERTALVNDLEGTQAYYYHYPY